MKSYSPHPLQLPCPTCGAKEGWLCVDSEERPAALAHPARQMMSKEKPKVDGAQIPGVHHIGTLRRRGAKRLARKLGVTEGSLSQPKMVRCAGSSDADYWATRPSAERPETGGD